MLFLFGTKTQYEHIAPLEMTCPLCGRKTCGLYWSAQKATAYFIPVATLKRTYVTGCSRCEKYWEVDQSLAKRLHRQLKPETAAVAEAPSGKAPTAAAGP